MNQILSTASPKAAAPQSIAEVRGALSFIRPRMQAWIIPARKLDRQKPAVLAQLKGTIESLFAISGRRQANRSVRPSTGARCVSSARRDLCGGERGNLPPYRDHGFSLR